MNIPANDWIAHHASFIPDNEAMQDLESDRHFSYKQMHTRVDQSALYLREKYSVKQGDRVAVLCHNDTDTFELQFACRRLGAIFLPINTRLAIPELEYICTDASPKVLLYGTEFTEDSYKG